MANPKIRKVSVCDLAPETVASFIGATHSLRSLNGVSNETTVVSALLEHSKHSLETLEFDGTYAIIDVLSQPSLQPLEKLTHFILPISHLIAMSNSKPPQIEYTAEDAIDAEKSDVGIVNRFELATYLPP